MNGFRLSLLLFFPCLFQPSLLVQTAILWKRLRERENVMRGELMQQYGSWFMGNKMQVRVLQLSSKLSHLKQRITGRPLRAHAFR